MWLVIFGGGLGASLPLIENVSYQSFVFPGILGMSVLFSAIFFGVYIIWDKRIDFLKEVLVAPISRTTIFMGKVFGGATDSLAQAGLLLIIGIALSQLNFLSGLTLNFFSIVGALLLLFLATIAFVSIGLIIGSLLERIEGFQLITSFLLFPMLFLSGAFFSIKSIPQYIAPFTYADPLTYAIDGLRAILLKESVFPIFTDAAVLGVFAIVLVSIGVLAFRRMKF